MPTPSASSSTQGFEPVYPITDIAWPSGLVADMRRSIARNEKAIVAHHLRVLADVMALQPRSLAAMDATTLFEAACHKQGSGVSRMLIEAGLIAHKSTALMLALKRGHVSVFNAQIDSITKHDPINAFYTVGKSARVHLLSATMLKGLSEPLARLLDIPVHLDEMFGTRGREFPLLQPNQIANLLLSIACTTPPPHSAIDTVDVLITRGADPYSWRFGVGDHWIESKGNRSWIATSFSNGNLDMGVALLDRCRSRDINVHTRSTLGKECGAAIIEHADSTCLGPAKLEPRHRLAMQAVDEMGFPMPLVRIDEAGVWSCQFGLGDHRQLERSSGEWLHALSARGHMAMETDLPQSPMQRTPRF